MCNDTKLLVDRSKNCVKIETRLIIDVIINNYI